VIPEAEAFPTTDETHPTFPAATPTTDQFFDEYPTLQLAERDHGLLAAALAAVPTAKGTVVSVEDNTRTEAAAPIDPIAARGAEILGAIAPDLIDDRDLSVQTILELLRYAAAWSASGDLEGAVIALELALSADREAPGVDELLDAHRALAMSILEAFIGDRSRVAMLSRHLDELGELQLDQRAVFLLSYIDTTAMPIGTLLEQAPMPLADAYRHLCQLILRGIVVV
jgi:hypothetical protein